MLDDHLEIEGSSITSSRRYNWQAPNNLDNFYREIYFYHKNGGFWTFLNKQVNKIIVLGFSIFTSVFLIGFVEWSKLINPMVQETDIKEFIKFRVSSIYLKILIGLYFCISILYLLFLIINFLRNIPRLYHIKSFYKNILKIRDKEISVVEWDFIIRELIRLNNSREIIIQRTTNSINELDIVQRIMRIDNYFIGLIEDEILPLKIFNVEFMSKILEWTIRVILLNPLLNSKFNIVCDPMSFRIRCRTLGFLQLLSCPFTFLFLIARFFLQHIEELHSRKTNLGVREWSDYAKWKYARFNELPHKYEYRLNCASYYANKYILSYPSPRINTFAETIIYISGSMLGIILLSGILEDSLLTELHILNKNLIWWIAVLGAILACSRVFSSPSFSLDKSLNNHFENLSDFIKIDISTKKTRRRNKKGSFNYKRVPVRDTEDFNMMESKYFKRLDHTLIYERITELFTYKFSAFLQQLWIVLILPWWLLFILPKKSDKIYHYLREHTCRIDHIGDVCIYGKFDRSDILNNFMEESNNINASDPGIYTSKIESLSGYPDSNVSSRLYQSIDSFRSCHPTWKPDNLQQSSIMPIV